VVDFDGDGTLDILSGSWPGELYLFRGQGKGKFAAGQTLKDKNGKVIKADSASTAFASDWNGDGLNDLLIGSIGGHIYLCTNEGSADKPAFSKPQKLSLENKPLEVPHGDSHPVATDWDRDGNPDLLVGCGDGSVRWYRNIGSRTAPKLKSEGALLGPSPMAQSFSSGKANMRGMRAKICVTDWNGDGLNDLLVGDFGMALKEAPKLTEAQKKRQRELQAKIQTAEREMQPIIGKMRKLGPPPADTKKRAAWNKQSVALREQYNKPMNRLVALSQELEKFQPSYEQNGYVWLLTAQRDEVAHSR
jgi:hypothetical protein